MGRLDGKVTAITGGASGIGEATVQRFVAEGARVGFVDRNGARGAAVAAEIEACGGQALFVEARTDHERVAADFIRRTVERFGRLDILVNNAGIRLYHTVVEASGQSWDTILSVNVKGYAFSARAAIPAMCRAGGGAIVNVASNSAVIASANAVEYDTTKTAVTGLTRAMARDHAADGIRVNALCPGPTFTRYHAQRAAAAGKTAETYNQESGRTTMLNRTADPSEIAACILFLACDDASFVTGTCLFADGGESVMGGNDPMKPADGNP